MARPRGGAMVRSKKLIPEHMIEVADAAIYVQLNFFPTPPWATRSLIEHVIGPADARGDVWDPCCGLGHMAEVLAESFELVRASDVIAYNFRHHIFDLLGDGAPPWRRPRWTIMNPAFDKIIDFIERGLESAEWGLAVLARHAITEGAERYERIWEKNPPRIVAPFSERLSMCCGGWDAGQLDGSVAHAWFVWTRNPDGSWPTTDQVGHGQHRIIPPGREKALTRPEDAALAALHLPGWIAPSKLKKPRRSKQRRRS